MLFYSSKTETLLIQRRKSPLEVRQVRNHNLRDVNLVSDWLGDQPENHDLRGRFDFHGKSLVVDKSNQFELTQVGLFFLLVRFHPIRTFGSFVDQVNLFLSSVRF